MHCIHSLEASCPPIVGLDSRWKSRILLLRFCVYEYKYRKACHASFELGIPSQVLTVNPHSLVGIKTVDVAHNTNEAIPYG